MWKLFTKKDKRTSLEKEIEEVLEVMNYHQPESKEYTTISKNLELLYKAKSLEPKREWPVKLDTIITVAGSLLGILLILDYEKEDSVTSKALGFIVKGRV